MIRRIILENYMSHGRTVIEPAAGLTVLAGPNNCGKSAVISALLSLRGDGEQAGDFMVRHGERLCSVTVETDDGHTIVWRRKGSSVSYVIDGVEVHRAGRGNAPDKLAELLRMPRVEPANTDKKFDLHFGLQKEPIFLIDSESDAARFFSASNDAERLLQMQQLQKERVKASRLDERKTKAEVARIDGKLAALGPLAAIDGELVEAERQHEAVVREVRRAEDLRRLIEAIGRQAREAERFRKIVAELSQLTPPPVPHDTAALIGAMGRLRDAERAVEKGRAAKGAMADLLVPPVVESTDGLGALVEKLGRAVVIARIKQQMVDWLRRLQDLPALEDEGALKQLVTAYGYAEQNVALNRQRVEAMRGLREVPGQEESRPLVALIEKMQRVTVATKLARGRRELLADLREVPVAVDPAPLQEWIGRCEEAKKRVQQRRKIHAATLAALVEVEGEIDRWVCDNPACPTCGGETDRKRLLGATAMAED